MKEGRLQLPLLLQRSLLLATMVSAMVVGSNGMAVFGAEFPMCGDCWCVPDDKGTAPCPPEKPQTEFSDVILSVYKAQVPVNAYQLYCNPYTDVDCQTTPVQEMIDNVDAVCAFHYVDSNNTCSTYSLLTYSSRIEAENAGDILTHLGSCGLCSTTQDLAVYLSEFVVMIWFWTKLACRGRLYDSWKNLCHEGAVQ
jgi:hypothetical protein